jgi:hypothetical protein
MGYDAVTSVSIYRHFRGSRCLYIQHLASAKEVQFIYVSIKFEAF